ncbi:hypothetical protein [Vibrio viridaestus]|uniref:Threonine transporter RhtB n=1 Tax=Vibrio viridaestus TaxID=2487322 RepID=A0A3N9TKW1_9VIBR|nr:hypothetical protein [Vibrio viridaestus]RQW64503.1 hypothetical protein EES38_00185 [Vibrio viridaestus]
MKKVILLFSLCLIAILGYKVYGYYADLHYLPMDMTWKSKQSGFSDSRFQISRTADTHQLVLRQVNRNSNTALYVSTTLNNHFDVFISIQADCDKDKIYPAQINKPSLRYIQFHCDANGHKLSFRYAWKKAQPFVINIADKKIDFVPGEWDLALLKKDQFMQLHSNFFRGKSDQIVYDWRRD